MKITKIVKLDKKYNNKYSIYEVTFEPTWLEKLFGIKAKNKQYRETGYHYNFNGVSLYINQNGKDISCVNRVAKAIDKFKNSW